MGAVTLSLSNAFQQLLQRWQASGLRSKASSISIADGIVFFQRHVLLTIVAGSAASAAFGAYCMYRFVGSDVPALRAEFHKMAAELSARSAAEALQRSDLKSHTTQEQVARDRITSDVRALGIQAIVLTQKVERRALKPQEVKDLLTGVSEISVAEASHLESIAMIGGVLSDEYLPLLAFGKKEEDLRQVAGFFHAATPSVQPAYLGKLLLIKDGVWRAGDRQISFKWHGGSARLRAAKDLPQSEIARMVDLFNSVSQAISQAALTAPRTEPAPRPAIARQAAPTARTAQTSRRALSPRPNGAPVAQRR